MQVTSELQARGYRLGPRLGKGSYAKVKLAERFFDDRIVAIKIINKNKAAKEFVDKFLPRELAVQLTLQHRNIIRIFEVIHQEDVVCVVMEYAPRGDLLDFVKRRGWLKEEVAGPLFYQVCSGLSFLHAANICHRDLKCENILLKHDLTAAISDFGFARTLDGNNTLSQTYCGSAAYASPELLRGRPYKPLGNDVWSLGCVLFIMITGQMPFFDKNTKKMLYRQLKGKVIYPENVTVSGLCRDLVSHVLQPNISLRWKVDTVMTHPWLDLCTNLQHTEQATTEMTNSHITSPESSTCAQEPTDNQCPAQKPDESINPSMPTTEVIAASNPNPDFGADWNQHENQAGSSSSARNSGENDNFCVKQEQPSSKVGSLLSLSSLNSEDDRIGSVGDHVSLCRIRGKECVLQPGRPLSPVQDSETAQIHQNSSSSVVICASATDTSTSIVQSKESPALKDTTRDFKKSIQKILQSPLNVSNHPRSQELRWQPKNDKRLTSSCRNEQHQTLSLTKKLSNSENSYTCKSTRYGTPHVNQASLYHPNSNSNLPGPSTENHSTAQTYTNFGQKRDIERKAEESNKVVFRTNYLERQSEFSNIPISHKTSLERAQTQQAGLVSQLRKLFETKDKSRPAFNK